MGNVLRILKRDILRLLHAPAALIVVIALMVLPSLYAWYNVVAFWNPYEATGNLAVSIVNQDAGTKTELTGSLNVGDKVVEELIANDQLNFGVQSFDEAMADLEAGDVFAVYVIPEDFTECLVSPLNGKVKTPQIVYYANEKLGPVSPKITDTAATTLDQTINSMFVSTVSEAAAQALDNAVGKAQASEAAAEEKATSGIDTTAAAIADVRAKLKEAQTSLDDAKAKTESAIGSLDGVQTFVADSKKLVNDVSNETSAVQSALASASSTTVSTLSGVSAKLSQVVTKSRTSTDGLLAKTGSARALVDMGAGRIQPLIDTLSGISQDLQTAAANLPNDSSVKADIQNAAGDLAEKSGELRSAVDAVTDLSTNIEKTTQAASDAAVSLDSASRAVSDSLSTYSDNLFGTAAPAIATILTQVNSSCALLSAAATDLETMVGEAQAGLRHMGGLLTNCSNALAQTDSLAEGLQTDIDSIASDIHLLSQSDTIANLVEGGSPNAQNIGAFMGSPTKLETVQMYHPNAYGSAMAPLFMNLTFWIGAFMLVIIFRTEVDDEGIKKITLAQRYLSRFGLFAGISVIQAIICCIGVLALGVQVANVPALFVAAVVSALAYLSIIYALSTTLQHLGKALCIILVFAQIPGGSGLYPLELTDGFFQALYPFLPFSYGIDALREAIGGFYGNFFLRDMGVLAAMFVIMLVLGMALGPLMSNVTRMAAHQIREGDLYNGEDAVVPERPYRLSQMISALSDREGFRENLERRYARFSKMYPVFIRASIVLAIGVPVALILLLAFDAGEKVVLLTIVLLWLIALLIFVLVVESMRSSFERQMNLEHISDAGASLLILNRNRLVPALAGITQRNVHSETEAASGMTSQEELAPSTHDEPSDEAPCDEDETDAPQADESQADEPQSDEGSAEAGAPQMEEPQADEGADEADAPQVDEPQAEEGADA